MSRRFQIGSVVHNKETKEVGKVLRSYTEDGIAMYEVAIQQGSYSSKSGWETGNWDERELESTNKP